MRHALRKPRASSTVHEERAGAQSMKDRNLPEILPAPRTPAML